MKQPLVIVAVLYGAGIVLGRYLEAWLPGTFAVALAITLLALFFARVRPVLLPAALFLFGWLNMSSGVAILAPHDLRTLWQSGERIVTLRGRIAEPPAERISIYDGMESSRTVAQLDVHGMRGPDGEWQPAAGRVMSRTRGVLPATFVAGQEVEVTGIVSEPPIRLAAGMFDYREHLRSQRIHYELKVDSAAEWTLRGKPPPGSFTEKFRTWAQRTLARGLPEEDEALRLQWAMLLGWKTALTTEVSEPFMRSGTMHIFAISGLHIALIAGIAVAVLHALNLPRVVCGLVVVPLIWCYTAATGWQASAIRATVMMSVIICGWALRRPSDLVNSLATAACLILIWDPGQLFQPGFQLSFAVVLSIALFGPSINRLKDRLAGPDPMLPDELRSAWTQRARRAGAAAWSSLSVSLAAFIGSTPLLAHYFHLFTPGSIAANLVIVPVSSLALMSGLGALVTGAWLPWVTELFNHSGWFWMRLMVWLSEKAAELPGAWCYVRSPHPLLTASYYALVLAACAGWFARPRLRWALVGFAVAVATWSATHYWKERQWHRLTVLPLNKAFVVHVECARGEPAWLINAGDERSAEFTLKPFLQSKGVDEIANLVLTHGETRFVGGAPRLAKAFPVENSFASPARFRSPAYRAALDALKPISRLQFCLTNGFKAGPWTVLHPMGSDSPRTARDAAVVTLGAFDQARALLIPPVERTAQNAIFGRYPDLRADIVIAAFSDDVEPASEWIELIQPKLVLLVDAGSRPTRQRDAIARLQHLCPTVLVNEETGAVTLSIRGNAWQMEATRRFSVPEPERGTDDPDVRDE